MSEFIDIAAVERNRRRSIFLSQMGRVNDHLTQQGLRLQNSDPMEMGSGFVGGGSLKAVGGMFRRPIDQLSKGGQKHRVRKMKNDLGDIIGTYVKGSAATNKMRKAIDKKMLGMDDFGKNRLSRLVNDIESAREALPRPQFPRLGSRKGPDGQVIPDDPFMQGMVGVDHMGLPSDMFRAVDKLGVTSRLGRGGRELPGADSRLAQASSGEIKFIDQALRQKYGKGLLDFPLPKSRTPNLLVLKDPNTSRFFSREPLDLVDKIKSALKEKPSFRVVD